MSLGSRGESARRLCGALRSAGIEVWFDQSERRGGDAWDAAIRKKAVDLDPYSHRAHQALAETLCWRKEMQAFRPSAERAIALNPMDGCAVASIGALMGYSGDWERGCALVQRVVALNSHHPGRYWFPVYVNAYRKGDYHGALEGALRIDIPGSYDTHVALAAAYGQLGEREEGESPSGNCSRWRRASP